MSRAPSPNSRSARGGPFYDLELRGRPAVAVCSQCLDRGDREDDLGEGTVVDLGEVEHLDGLGGLVRLGSGGGFLKGP